MNPANERRALLVLWDLVATGVAFAVAGWIRFGSDFRTVWEQTLDLPPVAVLAPLLATGVVVTFWASGLYRREVRWSLVSELTDLVRAVVLTALVVLSLLFVLRLLDVSRWMLVAFFALLTVLTAAARVLLLSRPRLGESVAVLLAGTDGADRVLAGLQSGRVPVNVVGYLGRAVDAVTELERLGDLMDLPRVMADRVVDEVIVCLDVEEWHRLDAIAAICEEQGKVMRLPVDVVAYTLRRSRVENIGDVPMLALVTTPHTLAQVLAKRVLDIVVTTTVLVLLSPLLAVVAIGLLIRQGRPLLYRQERGGLNGRPFQACKFRTMVVDADALKADLEDRNERVGPAFKVSDDPRVTPIGKFLRRTSIDELPQLWNVIRGEMSLVGPRPQPIEEVAAYDAWHRRRLSVKPGITGLWQVTARDDPSFDRWVDLDLQYIDSWSLWLDLKILAKTPVALLRTPGT